MKKKDSRARIILIGCGPHARRVYLPAISRLNHLELVLVIDLNKQKTTVHAALKENLGTEMWFVEPFKEEMPTELAGKLSNYVIENGITGVIIATEPLVHKTYANWALQNKLSILMDKPITARADSISIMSSAEGILKDYLNLLESYKKLQIETETVFIINSQRRFHKGFQFVNNLIKEIGEKTNCPVTFIQAYHSDGQWRLPNEIISQEYHPYCFGYGKASHSGYHLFDTIYQLYIAANVYDKVADSMEIMSSFIQPNGFFTQFKEADYKAIFGEQYNLVNTWSDDQLREFCKDFGELDLSAIISLRKNEEVIANINVNLIHNGYAGRTWICPGEDLYKGNGRIKHESYHIQQGPFQSIQIHSYQASDKHDEDTGQEEDLGGKNHFEIYVFRNPIVANNLKQPQVYKLSDLTDKKQMEYDSTINMERVKFLVVEEFADYLTGKKSKGSIKSQIEDHLIPVQIMSGIYCSNILRKNDSSNLMNTPFGLVEHYT